MGKIPEDVWDLARIAVDEMPTRSEMEDVGEFWNAVLDRVASAILAERNRAAAICESKMYDFGCIAGPESHDFVTLCSDLATAIRTPE